MKKRIITLASLAAMALLLAGCSQDDSPVAPDFAAASPDKAATGAYVSGILLELPEGDYYLAGAPVGDEGATDIPGHYWVRTGPDRMQGKHLNSGPGGAPQWWSGDAPDGEFLYRVSAILDTWSMAKAADYAERGYIHYHELVSAADGSLHPDTVLWLKHTARTHFTLDGGPHPELAHDVSPGLDLEFIPNGMTPYEPE